jgi:hypothetical protein
LVEPASAFAEAPAGEPVGVQRGRQSESASGVRRLAEGVFQRGADVRLLAVEPGEPVHLTRADPIGVSALDEIGVPVPVTPTQRAELAGLPQHRPAELPDGVQQPVPSDRRVSLADHDRLVDQ